MKDRAPGFKSCFCPGHVTWMRNNPSENMHVWRSTLENGAALLNENKIEDAEHLLRSALEAGHLYINTSNECRSDTIELFTETLSQLVMCVNADNRVHDANEIISYGLNQFDRMMANGADRREVLDSCQRLMGIYDIEAGHESRLCAGGLIPLGTVIH